MKKTLLLTTPIFYSNNKPHLGHAFTVVLADALKRWYSKLDYSVFFVTGTDEHGEKILKSAQKLGKNVEDFIFDNVRKFMDLWEILGIDYDKFVRTTEDNHKQTVVRVFDELSEKNVVYKGKWRGWYCVSCEESFSENFVSDEDKPICKLGHPISFKNESSYFLRISDFRNWLMNAYSSRDKWLFPERYKREMINNFVSELEDLSISRENLSWGIKLPRDEKYTFYVWFDALISYLTSVDWGKRDSLFEKYWNSDKSLVVQIIGKEICRFHSIYWPIILEILGVRQFDSLLIHGWLLMNDEKMSKSKGNVLDPVDILKLISRDGLRLFFLKLNYFEDNNVSLDGILSVYNSHLPNNLGNLLSRFYGILSKKFNYILPECDSFEEFCEIDLLNRELHDLLDDKYSKYILEYKFYKLVEDIFDLFKKTGKLIEKYRIWELDSKDSFLIGVMVFVYKLLFMGVWILSPILIDSSQKIYSYLNISVVPNTLSELKNLKFDFQKQLNPLDEIIFPRINV